MTLLRSRLGLACIVLALALAWAAADADPAQGERLVVRVGSDAVGDAPPLATSGFNIGNAMQVVGYQDRFEAIRIDSLRFPPGNQADEIHLSRADLAALAANLELLGHPPVTMVANLFGGSAEEAAALVGVAAEMGIDVHLWEIGNEPDLYATNRNDPTWTPERWCDAFRAFRDAILQEDPGARFAGPGVSGSRPLGETFLHETLRLCGDVIDVLTWHVYPTDGTWTDELALETSRTFSDEFARIRALAADPEANPLGHDREIAFGVTEFGLSWRSSGFRHLEDMTAALWLADVLGRMTAERLDLGHYFALQAMGGHGLIDIGGWVRPTYHVYAMLDSFTGEVLPVDVPEPLRAYAVRNGGGVELLLVNLEDRALHVDVRFADAPAADALEAAVLTHEIFDEALAPERAELPASAPIAVPGRAVVHLTAPANDSETRGAER